jgi:nucleoside-diphosphate-sugar epimerase
MKALVTGATGFVGSHLVEALLQAGWTVTALARSPEKAAALAERGVVTVAGDLHRDFALDQAVANQDIVYHVAGVVAARSEADFMHANRDGTRNLAAAAERGRCSRLILISSLAAAGPAEKGRPLDGSEQPHPVTAYGRSKLAAEQVVRATTLSWSIVRPGVVYGPRDREVLKLFRLARLGIAPIFGAGDQELSAIHAADLASALLAVGTSSRTVTRIYNACHPQVFSSMEFNRVIGSAIGHTVRPVRIPAGFGRVLLRLTEASARFTGQTTILTPDKANEFFQPAWTGDPSPLMHDTGWRPVFDLQSGLADTYRWYRKAGWL